MTGSHRKHRKRFHALAPNAALIGAAAGLLFSGVALAADPEPPPAITASPPPAPPASATLVFFRRSQFVAGGAAAVVKVNGTAVGQVVNGGAIATSVPPGDVAVEIRTFLAFGKLELPLKVEAGKEYDILLTGQLPYAIVGTGGSAIIFGNPKPIGSQVCGAGWCAEVIRSFPIWGL